MRGGQGNGNFHSFYIFSICVASLKSPVSSSLGSTATSSEPPESEDELLDGELRRSICSSIYAALCQGDSRRTTPTRQCCILIEEMGISRRSRPLLLTDRFTCCNSIKHKVLQCECDRGFLPRLIGIWPCFPTMQFRLNRQNNSITR